MNIERITLLAGLEIPLIGAISGALAGLIVNVFMTKWRFLMLYWKLDFKPDKRIGPYGRGKVINDYIYPICGAYVYITIRHDYEDVIEPPSNFKAYIRSERLNYLTEDRLCWALASPVDNPTAIDILPGEQQPLLIMKIDHDGRWIEIASEKGFSTRREGDISRVFLKPKKYTGYIKIVSMDTKAKIFNIQIDPNEEYPIKVL